MSDVLENIIIVVFIIAAIHWRAEKWAGMMPSYNYLAWIRRKLFGGETSEKQ